VAQKKIKDAQCISNCVHRAEELYKAKLIWLSASSRDFLKHFFSQWRGEAVAQNTTYWPNEFQTAFTAQRSSINRSTTYPSASPRDSLKHFSRSGAEKQSRSRKSQCMAYLDIPNHTMEFILLQTFNNYIDAHIVMGRLEEEGIQCWLKDENTVTINPIWTNAVGGIKLMVSEIQYERASHLLRQYVEEKKSRLACPNCKSNNIDLVSSPRKAVNWFSALAGFFFGDYAIAAEKTWHCFDCKADFEEPVDTSTTSPDR
jgi:hypothetical protein